MQAVSQSLRAQFLLAGAFWSAALLLALRSQPGTQLVVQPLVALQSALAIGSTGSPVVVDLSCAGSDVIALSIAAILAYPVKWRLRMTGIAVAACWLLALNTIRVATLVKAAGTPFFLPLHVYVWPAMLIACAALFVLVWIHWAERGSLAAALGTRTRALPIVTGLLVAVYAAVTPALLASQTLQSAAIKVAHASEAMLRAGGVDATVGGSTLVVGARAFLITPECITTPLMPIYLALALVWPLDRRKRVLAIALFVPVFAVLSVVRLLTVALPAVFGPPLFVTHGFYQLLIGISLIAIAVRWQLQQSPMSDGATRLAGAFAAAGVAIALQFPYTFLVNASAGALAPIAPHTWTAVAAPSDSQGAISIMPAYQLALLCGLAVACFGHRRWRRITRLIAPLFVLQVAVFVMLGELSAHAFGEVPTTFVRALAIVIPVLLVSIALVSAGRAAPAQEPAPSEAAS